MVTKAYIKEQYGNSQIINTIIDTYADVNGEIVSMADLLFGEPSPLTEEEVKEMIRVSVEALIKDLKNKIYPVEPQKSEPCGFSLESI